MWAEEKESVAEKKLGDKARDSEVHFDSKSVHEAGEFPYSEGGWAAFASGFVDLLKTKEEGKAWDDKG